MQFTTLLCMLALVFSVQAAVDRTKRCGSDTDCVMINDTVGGGQLLIDGLDLSNVADGETIKVVEDRLPSWFGPTRPLKFTFKGEPLSPTVPLAKYNIKLAETIDMASAAETDL